MPTKREIDLEPAQENCRRYKTAYECATFEKSNGDIDSTVLMQLNDHIAKAVMDSGLKCESFHTFQEYDDFSLPPFIDTDFQEFPACHRSSATSYNRFYHSAKLLLPYFILLLYFNVICRYCC
ncbi:hypothetical protein EGW08_022359 [Elysia chlorotica]|uniref:Uncharacterized protein n=1 Tax=Elysia chlorotica TaxID=188477 RepID=A0A433SLA0_ELYCH|nr:hypothetical protein EGW08_022359 [Elysia chlorotica]